MDGKFLAYLERLKNDPSAARFVSQMGLDLSKDGTEKSTPEDFAEHFMKKMNQAKAIYESERSLPPSRAPPPLPRETVEFLFAQSRGQMEERERKYSEQGFLNTNTFIGMPTQYSSARLSTLTPIRVRDLMVRKRHEGRYLLARIFTPANRIVAIQFAAEDQSGDAVHVSIYNFPTALESKSKFLDAMFPIGTIIAIREPTLKMPSSGGRPMIRIDSPSDLIFVHKGDKILKNVQWSSGPSLPGTLVKPSTFEEWKAQGDRHFKDKHYLAATMSYTEGLKAFPSKHFLLLNRSMAYLRLEFYARAWQDCDSVLQIDSIPKSDRVKALYRAGRAKYGLGEYMKAKKHFEKAFKVDSSQKDCQIWAHKCDVRMKEQSTGEYDITEMYKLSQTPGERIDVADYVGNVEVKAIPLRGGGRGVVASKNLRAGELLVVAKPLASVFEEDFPGSHEFLTVSNMITNVIDTKCDAYLINKVATLILGDPIRANMIYDLYPGPELPAPPPSYPPAAPTSQPYAGIFHDSLSINMSRVEGVVAHNAFMPTSLSSAKFGPHRSNDQEKVKGPPAALYTLPSLFNHSCVPNCSNHFFGDVMVIRALQNIDAGTELTICYGGHGPTYIQRNKGLKRWFGRCDCPLCEADRLDGDEACEMRELVMSDIGKVKNGGGVDLGPRSTLPDARRHLTQIKSTYNDLTQSNLPKMALFSAQLRYGYELQARGQYPELAVEFMNALRALGVKIVDDTTDGPLPKKMKKLPIDPNQVPLTAGHDGAVMTCLGLAMTFRSGFEDEIRAKRWFNAARWFENVSHGGGTELFNLRYENILRDWGLLDLKGDQMFQTDVSEGGYESDGSTSAISGQNDGDSWVQANNDSSTEQLQSGDPFLGENPISTRPFGSHLLSRVNSATSIGPEYSTTPLSEAVASIVNAHRSAEAAEAQTQPADSSDSQPSPKRPLVKPNGVFADLIEKNTTESVISSDLSHQDSVSRPSSPIEDEKEPQVPSTVLNPEKADLSTNLVDHEELAQNSQTSHTEISEGPLRKDVSGGSRHSMMLVLGQILTSASISIVALSGQIWQSDYQLYIVAGIFLAASVGWEALFRFKPATAITFPWMCLALAFFIFGLAFVHPILMSAQLALLYVATLLCIIASAATPLFLVLNFGEEAGVATNIQTLRACAILGCQQILTTVLLYGGYQLCRPESNARALHWSVPKLWSLSAASLFYAYRVRWSLSDTLSQSPLALKNSKIASLGSQVVSWYLASEILRTYWLRHAYLENWSSLSSAPIPDSVILTSVILFLSLVWGILLLVLKYIPATRSWLSVLAVGVSALRWYQMMLGKSTLDMLAQWTGITDLYLHSSVEILLRILGVIPPAGLGMILLQTLSWPHARTKLVLAQIAGCILLLTAHAAKSNQIDSSSFLSKSPRDLSAGLGSSGEGLMTY
ncbi:Cell wall alpha-1,3-glucan synthase ags1 [Tulasnella sp. 419]|nr:Cell wall alpha-1,3-glucan synthase ags1 [Tulasnella sp. 419]